MGMPHAEGEGHSARLAEPAAFSAVEKGHIRAVLEWASGADGASMMPERSQNILPA